MSSSVNDLVDEAIGRRHRPDPVTETTGGPAGNARMTAWTGLILLVLALAQLVTLLDVNGLISWHIVLGTLLVPVALLKTASTSWRVGRYYTGHRPYRTAGAPPAVLRFLGPLVVLSTFGLLGSGLALVFLGQNSSHNVLFTALGQRVDAVTLHQAIFFVWAAAAGLHLIMRLVPAVNHVTGRIQRTASADPQGRVTVPGGRGRLAILIGTLAVAGLAATLVLSASSSWRNDHGHGPGGRPPYGLSRTH